MEHKTDDKEIKGIMCGEFLDTIQDEHAKHWPSMRQTTRVFTGVAMVAPASEGCPQRV